MTFREQCALAAMREILSAGLARAAVADCGPLADMAWSCADAMQAERAKRVTPEVEPDGSVRIAELQAENHALASENAKLRAVAEAAARLQRLRNSNRPDGIGEASLQLDGALGNWLPGWRTK